jgi:hypothetical protein
MRSQVQVLAGPPPITAGHSAAGSEPGALAGCLGRAGAARPSPPARSSAPPGPSTRASGATTTTHRGRPPSSRTAATGPVRQPRAAACSMPSRSRQPRALRMPACLPGRSAVKRHCRRPYTTRPGSAADTPLTAVRPRQRRLRPGLLGPRPSRSTTRPPTGHSTRSRGAGCPPHRPGPQRPPPDVDETNTSGRTGWTPDGWTLDGWTVDGRTAGSPTTTPGERTPDGLDTRWLDRRIPDDETGWCTPCMVDADRRRTPWRASWHGRPLRRCPTAGCRLDASPGRRRLGDQQPRTAQQQRTARAPRSYYGGGQ